MAQRPEPVGEPAGARAGAGVALALAALTLGTLAAVALRARGGAGLGPADWAAIRFTLLQAGLSAALSVVLAVPVARALARRRFAGRRLLVALTAAPLPGQLRPLAEALDLTFTPAGDARECLTVPRPAAAVGSRGAGRPPPAASRAAPRSWAHGSRSPGAAARRPAENTSAPPPRPRSPQNAPPPASRAATPGSVPGSQKRPGNGDRGSIRHPSRLTAHQRTRSRRSTARGRTAQLSAANSRRPGHLGDYWVKHRLDTSAGLLTTNDHADLRISMYERNVLYSAMRVNSQRADAAGYLQATPPGTARAAYPAGRAQYAPGPGRVPPGPPPDAGARWPSRPQAR